MMELKAAEVSPAQVNGMGLLTGNTPVCGGSAVAPQQTRQDRMRAALTWNVEADVEQEHEPSLEVEQGLDDPLSFGEPARLDRRVGEQQPHEHAPGQCDRANEEEQQLPCADT
jgi:hypothetical protein